jgi:hypothetical protein
VKVKDLFDFYSEIHLNIDMMTLEELLFDELKKSDMVQRKNMIRWDEFAELSFVLLNQYKHFIPEKRYIVQYIKKFCNKLFN